MVVSRIASYSSLHTEQRPPAHRCNEYAAKGGQVYATARRTEAMAGLTDANIERLRMDAVGVDTNIIVNMGVHFSVPLTTLYTDYEGMITGDFDTARWQRRRARRT